MWRLMFLSKCSRLQRLAKTRGWMLWIAAAQLISGMGCNLQPLLFLDHIGTLNPKRIWYASTEPVYDSDCLNLYPSLSHCRKNQERRYCTESPELPVPLMLIMQLHPWHTSSRVLMHSIIFKVAVGFASLLVDRGHLLRMHLFWHQHFCSCMVYVKEASWLDSLLKHP